MAISLEENFDAETIAKGVSAVFIENVRKFRLAAGLSIRSLSFRSGISHSTLIRIENAQVNPTLETAVAIAYGLNTTLDSLLP